MLFQKENRILSVIWICKKRIDRTGNQKLWKKDKEISEKKSERTSSLDNRKILLTPISGISQRLSGKVSFGAPFFKREKASMAVETALVLPLFFLGMIAMISFMDIYKIQTEHLVELCERTKEAGMYAYVLDGSGPEEIILPDVYTYEPFAGLIPLDDVVMHNTVKVHAWTGKEYGQENGGQNSSQEPEEKMVYVTETGTVFHKSMNCSYLNLSVTQVSGSSASSMRNNYGERYHACETCSRNQKPAGLVYVTGTGNRYHNLETCSGLKRTVRLVKHSQAAEHMAACSRCG